MLNEISDLTVEAVCMLKLFDGEMHAVAPIVTRYGGDVDAFGIGIRQS